MCVRLNYLHMSVLEYIQYSQQHGETSSLMPSANPAELKISACINCLDTTSLELDNVINVKPIKYAVKDVLVCMKKNKQN